MTTPTTKTSPAWPGQCRPLAEAGLKASAPERGAIPVELPAGSYAFEFDLPPKI